MNKCYAHNTTPKAFWTEVTQLSFIRCLQHTMDVAVGEQTGRYAGKAVRERCVLSWALSGDKDGERRIFSGSEFQTGTWYRRLVFAGIEKSCTSTFHVDAWNSQKFWGGWEAAVFLKCALCSIRDAIHQYEIWFINTYCTVQRGKWGADNSGSQRVVVR